MANHNDRLDKQWEAESLLDTYVVAQDAQVELWRNSAKPEAARPEQDKATPTGRKDWRDAVGLAYSGEDQEEVLRLVALDRQTGQENFLLDATHTSGRIKIYDLFGMHEEATQEAQNVCAHPRDPLSMNHKIEQQLRAGDREGALETAWGIASPIDRAIALGKLGDHDEAKSICEQHHLSTDAVVTATPNHFLKTLVEALVAGGQKCAAESIARRIQDDVQRAEAFILTGNKEEARMAIQSIGSGTPEGDLKHVLREVLAICRDTQIATIVEDEWTKAQSGQAGSSDQKGGGIRIAWDWIKADLSLRNGDTDLALAMAPKIDEPFRQAQVYRRAGKIGEALTVVRSFANGDARLRTSELIELGQWREALESEKGHPGMGGKFSHFIKLLKEMNLPELTQKLHDLTRNQRRYLTWKHSRNPVHADAMTALGRTCDGDELRRDIRRVGEDTVERIAATLDGALEEAGEARHIVAVHQRPLRTALLP